MDVSHLRSLIAEHGSIRAVERHFRSTGVAGPSERTIRRMLKRSVQGDYEVVKVEAPEDIEVDVEALIERRIAAFARKHAKHEADRWHTIHMKSNAPIGLGFFGDPHLDNDGTDVRLAFEHAELFNGSRAGLYAACLGDVWDNWVGRLQRLFAEQSINAVETRALVEHWAQMVHWLFFVLGNHDCLDEQTECLTKRGWVHHSDIRDDDEVLSLNTQTGEAEWHPILMKVVRPNTDRMVTIKGQPVDMTVTPNHRILVQKKGSRGWSGWEYVQAAEMPGRFRIPVSGRTSVSSSTLTDDQIRFAAWVLTDGHIEKGKKETHASSFSIYQSKDSTDIEALLDRLGFAYSTYIRERDVNEICGRELVSVCKPQKQFRVLAQHSSEIQKLLPEKGVLPEWVFDLDDRQFDILLDTLLAGDGCWDGARPKEKTCGVLYGTHAFLSSVQAAAVAHGWRAYISEYRSGEYRLNLTKTESWEADRLKSVGEEQAADIVWCLTVPLTNFMVRRNGKAYFTGNCWNDKTDLLQYMLGATADKVSPNGQRVRIVFPNGKEVKIHARHTFPGRSQWVTNFGQLKAAQLDGSCDIYIAGHTHVSGYSHGWHEGFDRMWHAVQVASYKALDSYADELGLAKKDIYQCPVAIIDPNASQPVNFIRWEFDPFEGAERVAWMRSRS